MVSKRWSWLAALGVLFAGLTNAHSHIHYCFDGQEPPATVHLVDSTEHAHEVPGHHDHHDDADPGGGGEHDDLDLDVPNQVLAKSVKHDLPAITAQAWTAVVEFAPGTALTDGDDIAPAPNPRYAHPQLRAPPR
jgi:hypothetical protein